uniref:Rhodanese domain-containing protein n=1 Tax=Oryzias latipes TaxID=8090 RepID=A0A3B3HVF8_ORYLA
MAFRGCWRFVGVVPRLLWDSSVPWRASVPVGRSCVPVFYNSRQGLKTDICLSCDSLCVFLRDRQVYFVLFSGTELQLRGYSSEPLSTEVSYEQLKQRLNDGNAVVIDVREPWELREYGFIPGSVNVPLGQVNTALQLSPEDFREKFGAEMPRRRDNIVFLCLAGIRSKAALDTAASLGFKDAQHYPDGWQGWAEREDLK